MHQKASVPKSLVLMIASALVVAASGASAQARPERNFDARATPRSAFVAPPNTAQQQATERLRAQIPELGVEYDPGTGTARTLYNRVGYLSSQAATDPMAAALNFVESQLTTLGLTPADLKDYEVTDAVFSKVTGAHHIYLRQRFQGIPVYNGQLHINVNRDGYIISVNNGFVADLARMANGVQPTLAATDAIAATTDHLGFARLAAPTVLSAEPGPQRTTHIAHPTASSEPITARLMWLPMEDGTARLVWNFELHTLDQEHMYDNNVDAETGQVWTRFDWVADDRYRVYEMPVESPNHTSPLPPADARTVAVDPADATASRLGWHDTGSQTFTIMRGNNAHAYEDSDANNQPPANQPSCGTARNCDFPINLSASPATHVAATLANVFYWSNIIHDVQYHYGFDEPAGNFQVNNFGQGGAGNDDVRAEIHDGSGTCNANFGTPPDGSRPRMQMFLCPNTNPSRDSALDNATVIHEYGHGISIRQVGGPSNSSCLNNRQQPGEGWGDWWDQVYTIEVGDQGTDRRPDGTYFIGQDADGPGIRPQPYSTDPAINNFTYASISGLSVPHGLGSVWAQALVEVNWALIDRYGFDPDFFNRTAGAGNHRSMLYVNEGLKNTACSPTFTQARDGILQAAADNFGGQDVCLLWDAFANFGLGVNAVSGGSNSTNPTNGFEVPASCQNPPPPPPPSGSCLFTADFNNGPQSFTFVDDPQDPGFTSGTAAGGTVSVAVGGIDNTTVTNLLGSWDRACTLSGSQDVTITVVGNLTQASDYESDEVSELRLRVNGSTNVLASFTGDGNGGANQTTGLQTFTLNTTLPSGASTIGLGCFNNKKTFSNEETNCVFDSIAVDAGGGPPPGQCTVEQDFDADATGWTNAAAATCTTGDYVRATPTEVVNGGVTTQVGGDHTSGTGSALFTATNTAAGTNDVDGGNCILLSPLFNVAEASTLSAWYFHGQRDAGDDAAGDFFRLEVSTNGGTSFSPLVAIGDATSNAVWTEATGQIPAGSQVQLRMQASDGTAAGDLIEAGIDDVSICPN